MPRLLIIATILSVASPAIAEHAPVSQKQRQQIAANAHTTTIAALQLGLDGDMETRDASLLDTAQRFPESPLAHWYLGDVWTGEDWVPYREVSERTGRLPQVVRYQDERIKHPDSFADHLLLADGCRQRQLFPEERAHLIRCLQLNWGFDEAHQRLGHAHIDGFWIPPEMMDDSLAELVRARELAEEWSSRIENLHRQFLHAANSKGAARIRNEFRKIAIPDAIPGMEQHLAIKGRREAFVFLEWSTQIESYRASEALARWAVFPEDAEIRTRAQNLLRSRRMEEYVPWLLSGLDSTKKGKTYVSVDPTARAALRISSSIEHDANDYLLRWQGHAELFPAGRLIPVRKTRGIVFPNAWGEQSADRVGGLYLRVLDEVLKQNRWANWQNLGEDIRTDRIRRALSKATGAKENSTTDDWRSWWAECNDIASGKPKTVLAQVQQSRWLPSGRVDPDAPLFPTSCFSRGTPVETELGPKPIERIRLGDLVLAQQDQTGELTFQPVIGTTDRNDAELLRISTSGGTFVVSQGHPFWVIGEGWRMAKELEPTMQLHALTAPVTVNSIDESGTGDVYNLVVDGFHTYFVGQSLVYTHDVIRREASDMIIPGYEKSFAIAQE
ncbi:MAG: hypothetical protein KDA80_04035 [Planctomycetaceae bacterium]|nr:hypothetical protein [Planctomycetaceae bacterium]